MIAVIAAFLFLSCATGGSETDEGPESDFTSWFLSYPDRMDHLDQNDPLFTSQANLGERRRAFGFWETFYIAGPPGMDYYTFSQLKNMGDLFTFWHVDPEDDDFFRLTRAHLTDFRNLDVAPVLAHQRKRFSKSYAAIVQ